MSSTLNSSDTILTSDFISCEESGFSSFEENGFVEFQSFLRRETVEQLREFVNSIYKVKHPDIDGEWVLNLHQQLPPGKNWIWKIATSPALVQHLTRHLGENYLLYASQIHWKIPKSQTQNSYIPWHQDGNSNVRTVWIPLDDIDSENGGLQVLPRCHHLGKLPLKRLQHNVSASDLSNAIQLAAHNVFEVQLPALLDNSDFNCITDKFGRYSNFHQYKLNAGGMALHHPLTPHSSLQNKSANKERRVIILRFMRCDEPIVEGVLPSFMNGPSFVFRKKTFIITKNAHVAPYPIPTEETRRSSLCT